MSRKPVSPAEELLARLRHAGALLAAGKAAEAAEIFEAAVLRHPRVADLHNNLGVARKAEGKPEAAIACYRRAVALKADYAVAWRNLAGALRDQGDRAGAVTALESGLAKVAAADSAPLAAEAAELLAGQRFGGPSPIAHRLMFRLFERSDIDLQKLAAVAGSLLLVDQRVGGCMRAATAAAPDPNALMPPADPLLLLLLSRATANLPEFESWLGRARRALLSTLEAGAPLPAPRPLLAAMAMQCHLTGFAFAVAADQERRAARVAAAQGDSPSDGVLAASMFLRLDSLPQAASFRARLDGPAPDLDPVEHRLLGFVFAEPAAESALAGRLEALTPIDDDVSRKVRAQYETHPYPNWRSADLVRREPLRDLVGRRFPWVRTAGLDLDRPAVLVAGCGTGRQAVTAARRHAGGAVLAVDLSRRSLAYAARMAGELGIGNVTFAQADILGLGALVTRYDMISCTGVLHHMADPEAGWRVLRGLLKPNGLMNVALYSRQGRKSFDAFRAPPPDGDATAAIRARRAEILALPDGAPARVLLKTADFYSLSGCRDLLFHVHEVQFDLLELEAMLHRLDLAFLGFDHGRPELMSEYRRRFPSDPMAAELSNWDQLERDEPDTFLGMYQFWCQARS